MNGTVTGDPTLNPSDRYIMIYNGVTMPCGAVILLKDIHQPSHQCPNSGNCLRGHKECWVFKSDESL